ncbi:hypothetical protein Emag_003246 [Eimeria magna]
MAKKTAGLVSGGKDSIFALHCAREMGHRICAVATLLPRDSRVETDSYMYQSVGTKITSAVAECLGVPHFCASVRGRPINTDNLDYETTSGDEVEDLYDLLSQVKEDLLREMVEWGLHAVLVKTASMGLTRKHLGYSVSDLLSHFIALHKRHGFHVCGEGGEYETLTLDCPLFQKGSIVVSEWQEVCHSEDPFAPVYLLSPVTWAVQPKDSQRTLELQADTEKLDAIELRRFQPYADQIRAAVKGWNSGWEDANSGGSAMSGVVDITSEQTEDTLGTPMVVAGLGRSHDWKIQVRGSSVGCVLEADVSVCNCDDLLCGLASCPQENIFMEFKDAISKTVGQWLDRQSKGSFPDSHISEGGSPLQTICQVAYPGLIPVFEELFTGNRVDPHPVTFVVTPLPHTVISRMRMVLGSSKAPTSPTALFWSTPAAEAVLHVHSLNWWLPPCSSGPTRKVEGKQIESLCFNCQGVRCEPRVDGAFSMARVFLRGCDGRFPHTGLLPDPGANSLLSDLAGQAEGGARNQQAIHVVLQTVSSFLNMKQALRMAQSGGPSDGLMGAAYKQIQSEPSIPERSSHPADFPPIILVFVKLDQATARAGMTTKAGFRSDRRLAVIKDLVRGLAAQNCHNAGSLRRSAQEEIPCIVVAAEVADLPEDALAMVQPLWSTARRGGEGETIFSTLSIERVQLGEVEWKGSATALACRWVAPPKRDSSSTEEMPDPCSSFVCICLNALECDIHKTSSSFGDELFSVIHTTLQKCSLLKANVNSDRQAMFMQLQLRTKQVLEVLVFYSVSWARLVWKDVAACEADLLKKITRACSQNSMALLQLPAVTFLPVKGLAGGFLELLFCFAS